MGTIFQKRKFCCKMIFESHIPAIKISFFGIFRGNYLPKKEIRFQNEFWITYAPIKNFLFGDVGPIKFPFLVILIAYVINNFLKRQFCFPRAKKFSSFLGAYVSHQNFLFWTFPFLVIPFSASYMISHHCTTHLGHPYPWLLTRRTGPAPPHRVARIL